MVEGTKELPRRPKPWYTCVVMHYMGSDHWAVGLRTKKVTARGLESQWEWVEGLSFEQASGFVRAQKDRLVRLTPGELKEIVHA